MMGGVRQNNEAMFQSLSGYLYGDLVEMIGLKAPGKYSASSGVIIFRFACGGHQNPSFL